MNYDDIALWPQVETDARSRPRLHLSASIYIFLTTLIFFNIAVRLFISLTTTYLTEQHQSENQG
jgi:hypothetical protein